MTDADERALIETVSARPWRRMLLKDMSNEEKAAALSLVSDGRYLILFVGDWVAVTDAGYELVHNPAR